MKKLIIAMAGCTLFALACKKSSSSSTTSTTTTSTTTTTTYPNKLTVVDNGSTLVAEGVGTTSPTYPMVILSVQKASDNNSVIIISTSSNNFKDFNLIFQASKGPSSGIGNYVILKSSGPIGNNFVEKFNGGLSYNIDTAVVTTTSCSSSNVSGTFTLWLSNSSSNKTVTGSFNCNQPTIL